MSQEIRSFGPFTLHLGKRQLLRGQFHVRLQPQPLRLLLLLTERPGELITREEIQRELWGEEVTVDFEQGLNFAIRQVRHALGDSGAAPVYIQTEPRVGYRFIGPLERTIPEREPERRPEPGTRASEQEAAPNAQPEVTEKATLAVAKLPIRSRRFWFAALGLTAFVILGVVFGVMHAPSGSRALSIAVLPVLNLTGSSSNDTLVDGLSDALATQISMMTGTHLRVVGGSSTALLRERGMEPSEAGRELGTTYVLKSTLQGSATGEGLTLTLQMYKTADDSLVWTHWYESDKDHLLSASNELAGEVITALPLGVPPVTTVSAYISPSPVAREAYQRGRQGLEERTQEGLNSALDSFKVAVAADPSYAEAFAQLAIAYDLLGGYGYLGQQEAAELADAAAGQALLLNPALADAHAARGDSRRFYHWDWKGAEEDFRQALQVDPSNLNALHWYALALETEGRGKEAKQQMERALALDPRSKILRTNRGWLDFLEGDLPAAAERMEAVLREDPYYLSARLKLWAVYSRQKRTDDAIRQLNYLSLDMLTPAQREGLAVRYHAQGYGAALRLWSQERDKSVDGNTLFRAQLATESGDKEEAVRILLEGFRTHDGWMTFALRDPILQEVCKDPRLQPGRKAVEQGQR